MTESERLRLPGSRDVRATLDSPAGDPAAAVVACPPHPQMGGDRRDGRLRAVSDALVGSGVACLRIDYGAWDDGRGERRDARTALSWLRDRYDRVGLFGYSFGAGVTLLAAVEECDEARPPGAVSVLAPPASSGGESTAGAVGRVTCPLQVIHGERDSTVDWEPAVEAARQRDATVEAIPGDHFFVGQTDTVGSRAGAFLADRLRAGPAGDQ